MFSRRTNNRGTYRAGSRRRANTGFLKVAAMRRMTCGRRSRMTGNFVRLSKVTKGRIRTFGSRYPKGVNKFTSSFKVRRITRASRRNYHQYNSNCIIRCPRRVRFYFPCMRPRDYCRTSNSAIANWSNVAYRDPSVNHLPRKRGRFRKINRRMYQLVR